MDFYEVLEEGIVGGTRVPLGGNGGGSPHAVNEAQGGGSSCGVHLLGDFQPWRCTQAFSFLTPHFSIFFPTTTKFFHTFLYSTAFHFLLVYTYFKGRRYAQSCRYSPKAARLGQFFCHILH